jgi:Xaa-Pro aminopeptidase
LLEEKGFDALLIFGSAEAMSEPVRYLAGYVHVFPTANSLVLIPREAEPILLIDQPWHLPEARKMSWIADLRTFPKASRRWLFDQTRSALVAALADRNLHRARIALIETELPVIYWRAITDGLPEARFEDGTDIWHRMVANPSQYDQRMIRETARVADAGHAAAVDASAVGAAEYEVCLAAYKSMAAMGAEFLHGSGSSTHVNIGSHSELISNVRPFLFTSRRLETGQMFWFDLTCSWAGYYNDCCRTISIGTPTPRQREIFQVCLDMYNEMSESSRPGVPGGKIWTKGHAVAERAGFGDYVNHVYFGHSTGIATSVRPVLARGETEEIRSNSFLSIEPGIFVPGVRAPLASRKCCG